MAALAGGHFEFTNRQRRIISILLILATVVLVAKWALNRTHVPDPIPASGVRAHELADRIDLETTDWQTLSVLPGIGESKARDILNKRDELRLRNGGQRAFNRLTDLYWVKGIGAATVEKLEPYLLFPETATTSPSK